MSSLRLKNRWETETRQSMTLNEALYSYTQNYLYMKGYSDSTIKNYRWAVDSLVSVIGDIPIEEVTLNHIIKWRKYTDSKGWDSNSITAYMYKIRLFFKYWSTKTELSLNLEDLHIPKRRMKLVKHLSLEEVRLVFQACNDDRERLIIALLYSTGVRVGELSRIRKQDIRGDELLVRGKGNKERIVFLDELAKECIKKRASSSAFVIDGLQGGLNRNTIERIVRGISRRSGVSFSPHVLRHTYATLLLSNGCNLRHIQELLGHADISTTQLYTHVSNNDLSGSFVQYHVALI